MQGVRWKMAMGVAQIHSTLSEDVSIACAESQGAGRAEKQGYRQR